jgi:hypothetical protein
MPTAVGKNDGQDEQKRCPQRFNLLSVGIVAQDLSGLRYRPISGNIRRVSKTQPRYVGRFPQQTQHFHRDIMATKLDVYCRAPHRSKRVERLPLCDQTRNGSPRQLGEPTLFDCARCLPGDGCAVEYQVKKLVEQLFTTQDLRAVQSLAVELQRAIYEHIQQLREKLTESSQSNDQPAFEGGLSNTMFEDPSQETDDQS